MRISSIVRSLSRGLSLLGSTLFGQFSWQPPTWCRRVATGLKGELRRADGNRRATALVLLVLAVMLAGLWQGWYFYRNRPVPLTVNYQILPPSLTDYTQDPAAIGPLQVRFDEAAAPLAMVNKEVMSGLRLDPAIPGAWHWRGDRILAFTPQGDWPVDTGFQLSLARSGLLNEGILLADYQSTFRTAPFTGRITKSELYQDPSDPRIKKLVATVRFSHPVDEESLRRTIHLKLGPGLDFQDPKSPPWTLHFDGKALEGYIQSAPLATPLETARAVFSLDAGIRAAGTEGQRGMTREALTAMAEVPGRYRLSFTEPSIRYVKDQEGGARQVLMFTSSFPLEDAAIARHVHAWLLPACAQNRQCLPPVPTDLSGLEAIELTHIPAAGPQNQTHSFSLKVPPERYLYVKIDAAIEAVGGYLAKDASTARIGSGEYPKTLRFMGDGALLSLSGGKQVGVMAQGIPGMRVEIARILPGQLHQMVGQNYGDFAHPSHYGQNLDRLAERETFTRVFGASDPAGLIYESIDLAPYLDSEHGRRGLFILRAIPYDPRDPNRYYSDNPGNPGGEDGDRRLLLVSDLGIIAKKDLSGGYDIFIQSIASGHPREGVRVALAGRNGQPVAEGLTDAQGHVRFPYMEGLQREKTPTLLTAESGGDFSYLPLDTREHGINFSRFDVGGGSNQQNPNEINAFVFTDRGLYRPGETAHIAFILRDTHWSTGIDGIPLRIEVTDPRGQVVDRQTRGLAAGGFDAFDFTSSAAAPAGEYTATVSLVKKNTSGSIQTIPLGSAWFRVQDFEPDRMKVQVQLADFATKGWLMPVEVKALVKARHLFGANAGDRRVGGELRISPAFPSFRQYPDYRFYVEKPMETSFTEELEESTTNEQGEAELNLHLDRFQAESYRLAVTAKVYEAAGGRGVAAEDSVLISPASALVGVKSPDSLDYVSRGAVRTSHWLAVGPDLIPLARDGLQLSLIEYRSVSVLVKQNDGTYKYESRRKEELRERRPVSLPAGGLDIALPTAEPGDFAYELRDAKGAVLNRLAWTVAGSGNLSRSLERNAELQIRLDKKSYAPGEDIAISLRAPYTGSGLITIERDRVYAWAWFTATTTASVQHITLPEGIEGNAYINVQFMRDPSSPEIFMSPLSSGVAPFAVSLAQRTLPLRMEAVSSLEPGQEIRVRLESGDPGQPTKALLFAVDEGILQVARYNTPEPLRYFFPKRMLQVETAQIISLILPEFRLLYQASAPGGGGDDEMIEAHLNPFKRKNKPPVVYWSGIVDLPAGGREFSYTVPDYFNGRLRIIAVALTQDRIGVAEKAAEVRGPWVITPNIPAFVAPGDEFVVSAGLFNNLANEEKTKLSLKPGSGLTLMDGAEREMAVASRREGLAEFRLRAGEELGSVSLDFTAASEGGSASLHEEISLRPATPYRVSLRTGLFRQEGFSLRPQRELFVPYRQELLAFGPSPLVWGLGLQAYLDSYPYGCTEQLISRAMSTLILAGPDSTDAGAMDAAFTMLRQRRNEDGGFSLWPGDSSISPQLSVYTGDFLLEAGERGFAVPADLKAWSQRYLDRIAANPADGLEELRAKAQAIYLCTRQGRVMAPAAAETENQLERYHAGIWRQDLAAAWLAASHLLMRQDEKAEKLIAKVAWKTGTEEKEWMGFYDDPLAHDAELLGILARHFPQRLAGIPDSLMANLSERLSKNRYNSLSAALLIRAFNLYQQASGRENDAFSAQVQIKDKTLPLALTGRPTGLPLHWDKVFLRKEGALPAFYMVNESGFDRRPPEGELKEGLEIRREYLDEQGRSVSEVPVGGTVTVRLILRATKKDSTTSVAVVDLLPGGTEPVIEAKNDEEDEEQKPNTSGLPGLRPVFVDTRDDRLVIYATPSREAAVYEYRIRAVNTGSFQTPPPYAEGMYDRTLQGRGQAGALHIVNPH